MLNRNIAIPIVAAAFLTSVVAESAEFEQSYRILDPQNFSSAYLYANGRFEITCKSTDLKEVVTVDSDEEPSINYASGIGSVVYDFTLTIKQIEKRYRCGSLSLHQPLPMIIKNIYCDPRSVKPPNMTCKHGEVCIITADNGTKCGTITEVDCFLGYTKGNMIDEFPTSFPINRVVCTKDSTAVSELGLCYARSTSVKTLQINGLATTKSSCSVFESVKLNGKAIEQDGLLTESLDPAQWNITLETKLLKNIDFYEAYCLLIHPILKIVTIFNSTRNPKLNYIASERENFTLPNKLQLRCELFRSEGIVKDVSTYVLVYNSTFDNEFLLESLGNDPHKTTLICKCSVPFDLFCRVSWEHLELPTWQSSSELPESRHVITKHIYKTGNPTIQHCYGIVYVIQHPFSYKSVELQGLRWNSSVTIEVIRHISTIPLYRATSYADGKPHGNYLTTKKPGNMITATYDIYNPINPAPNTVPLYEYIKQFVKPNIIHDHHFYTTNPNEIGTIKKGEIGKYGYRFKEIIGYCFMKTVPDSEPLYAGRIPGRHSLFYSTSLEEIAGQKKIKNPKIVCHLPK